MPTSESLLSPASDPLRLSFSFHQVQERAAPFPALRRERLPGERQRRRLQVGPERVVPAIEKAEQGDHGDDLRHLVVVVDGGLTTWSVSLVLLSAWIGRAFPPPATERTLRRGAFTLLFAMGGWILADDLLTGRVLAISLLWERLQPRTSRAGN